MTPTPIPSANALNGFMDAYKNFHKEQAFKLLFGNKQVPVSTEESLSEDDIDNLEECLSKGHDIDQIMEMINKKRNKDIDTSAFLFERNKRIQNWLEDLVPDATIDKIRDTLVDLVGGEDELKKAAGLQS